MTTESPPPGAPEPGRPGGLRWLLPALAIEICLLLLATGTDLSARPFWFVGIHLVAFAAYVAALVARRHMPTGRRGFWWVLGIALVFRATLLPSEPSLSDGVFRDLWDGRLQVAGINPYRHAPDAEELGALRDANWERIRHPGVSTTAPPLMQGVFAAIAWVSPTVLAFKLVMVLFDVGIILLLARLLAAAGGRMADGIIYAWNPLVVLEVAGSGHNDVVAVSFLLLALLGIVLGRRTLSTAGMTCSILSKLVSVVLLPMFLRRVPWARLWPLPLLLLAALLPFLSAGRGMFGGLVQYSEHFEHNDFLFRGILALVAAVDPTEALEEALTWLRGATGGGEALEFLTYYTHPQFVARLIALAAMIAMAVYVSFKPWIPSREMLVALTAVLLLAPTLHPWYLLWIAPLLCLHPSRALILWTGLAPLSYALPASPAGGAPAGGILLWAQYVPVFALLIYEISAFRRRSARAGQAPGGW